MIPILGAISSGMLGLLAAGTAAFFWSVATVLYRQVGRVMPPVRLNLVKGIAAMVVLGGVVAWQAMRDGANPLALSLPLLGIMAISGVIGIGGGDTCFFAALNRLGPRRSLLMFMLSPALTALVAWPLLGQPLSLVQTAGIALTCGGIAWVIAERTPGGDNKGNADGLGLLFALGAAICQAAGALMSRYVFDQADFGAAPSAFVRIVAGTSVLVALLPLDRYLGRTQGRDDPASRPSRAATWSTLLIAMMFGTVFGIWLQQVSFKLSDNVGVASTLLSTSPLFVLPIAAATGERVSPRAVLGALVGVLGIALLLGGVGR